jgi:hypothetical protein
VAVGNVKRVTEIEISVEMETTVTQYINFKNISEIYINLDM